MSVAEVLAGIDHALNKINEAQGHITTAQNHLDEAGAPNALGMLLNSYSDDAQQALALAGQAAEDMVRSHQVLNRVTELVAAARKVIAGEAPTAETSTPAANAPRKGEPKAELPAHKKHPEKVREIHQKVGQGITGGETKGGWLRSDGSVERVSSGKDQPYFTATQQELERVGKEAGDPRGRLKRLATHVEMQFVTKMREDELTNETLVLDRPPCGITTPANGPFQCDMQLDHVIKRMLPPNAALTVISPDGGEWVYPKGARRST